MSDKLPPFAPRPQHWPHRADPPGRYWNNYDLYQRRGGLVRLEDDVAGLLDGKPLYTDMARFYFFSIAFDQLMKECIVGDVAELGTYKGLTGTLLAKMARRMGTTAWILDTFEGFSAADLTGIDGSRQMQFADTSLEAVRALVGDQNVRFVKGYFPDSATQLPSDRRYCLVHIDCDLYQPIFEALKYFYPRLVPGGYLIVHDYASLAWDGAERAVDEFFADKPEAAMPLTDGGGSVVIRKARVPGRDANWLARKRAALFSRKGVGAGNNALMELLGAGWSAAEPWGVWGVGASHRLDITLADDPGDEVLVEVDASAALLPERPSHMIDVLVAGRPAATWHFTMQQNRARRQIRVAATDMTRDAYGFARIALEFRPRTVSTIKELRPDSQDVRALGLGLFGLRRG